MRVVILGATGMVGAGVLLECLDDSRIDDVIVIGRRSCDLQHDKLLELLHDDFFDYDTLAGRLTHIDACFFCLGVPSLGKTEDEYTRLTHDLTLAAAEALLAASPQSSFLYISAAGADSTAQGSSMWARVRGRLENKLFSMPFKSAHALRPGFIRAMRGVTSSVRLYGLVYALLGWIYPVLKRFAPNSVTSTVTIGRAMIHIAAEGWDENVLEMSSINRAGASVEGS
jgi:uncharacterized protein YbjT (DUF2867 family)